MQFQHLYVDFWFNGDIADLHHHTHVETFCSVWQINQLIFFKNKNHVMTPRSSSVNKMNVFQNCIILFDEFLINQQVYVVYKINYYDFIFNLLINFSKPALKNKYNMNDINKFCDNFCEELGVILTTTRPKDQQCWISADIQQSPLFLYLTLLILTISCV